MSHIAVTDLLGIAQKSNSANIPDYLRAISKSNAKLHSLSSALRLPQLLFDEAGVL